MKSHADLSSEQEQLKRLIFQKCQAAKFSKDEKSKSIEQLSCNLLAFLSSIKETSDANKVYFFLLQLVSFKEPLIENEAIGLLSKQFFHISPTHIFEKAKDNKEIDLGKWMVEVIAQHAYQKFEKKLIELAKQFDEKAKLQIEGLYKLLHTRRKPFECKVDASKIKIDKQPARENFPKNPDYVALFKATQKRIIITEADFFKKLENGLLNVINPYRNRLINTLKTSISVKLLSGKKKSVKEALKEKSSAIVHLIKLNKLLGVDLLNQTPIHFTREKLRILAGYQADLLNFEAFLEQEKPFTRSNANSQSQTVANRK